MNDKKKYVNESLILKNEINKIQLNYFFVNYNLQN